MTALDLFSYAESQAQARAGMAAALDHADAVTPAWREAAYAFLCNFAHARHEFISEDVSDASKADPRFPQPPTDRAWGSIYIRAAKAGVIVQCGIGRSRRRHASHCLRWRSLVWGAA